MSKLLLLSNSTLPATPFFTWPTPHVVSFLKEIRGNGLFIPFAAVTLSYDEYALMVETAFTRMGLKMSSIHNAEDKQKAINDAAFIAVGGGNSFALLSRMIELRLMDVIREKVLSGIPYIGWSAGANLACPTIMTTNDMPIVQPPSFKALNLIPFQINPHYHELKFEGQGGETRRERLEEFLVMNPDKKIMGLPEGMLVERDGNQLLLKGNGESKLYDVVRGIQSIPGNSDISFLLSS